jgi:hypothetical protein
MAKYKLVKLVKLVKSINSNKDNYGGIMELNRNTPDKAHYGGIMELNRNTPDKAQDIIRSLGPDNTNIKRFRAKYIPNCIDYNHEAYQSYMLNDKINDIFDIINKIPSINFCNLLPNNLFKKLILSDQHAVVISNNNDKYPIIGTFSLNACIGLILYEAEYKIGCVMHMDGLPAYSKESAIKEGNNINFDPINENIVKVIKIFHELVNVQLNNINNTNDKKILNINVNIIGGLFGMSEIMVIDIYNCLKKSWIDYNIKFNIIGKNLFGPDNQMRNIALDTDTGKLYTFDYFINHYYTDSKNIIPAKKDNKYLLDVTYIPFDLSKKN